jgi:hypothetical protein
MGVEDSTPSREKEILTDLPIAGIGVKSHCSPNDLDRNRKTLFVNLGGELVEVEKMLGAENDDTPMRTHWIKVRKTDCPPDADPSFRDNFFKKLRCLLENILWAKETSF